MAHGHGGSRPGSGRPKGSHNGARLKTRVSPEHQARAAEAVRLANGDSGAFPGDAYTLLVSIYRSPDLPITLRMRAAEAAIAYERPKLAQVEVNGDAANPLHVIQNIMRMLEGTGRGLPSEVGRAHGPNPPIPHQLPAEHGAPSPVQPSSARWTVQETVRDDRKH